MSIIYNYVNVKDKLFNFIITTRLIDKNNVATFNNFYI